jgi:hypothetical protein
MNHSFGSIKTAEEDSSCRGEEGRKEKKGRGREGGKEGEGEEGTIVLAREMLHSTATYRSHTQIRWDRRRIKLH